MNGFLICEQIRFGIFSSEKLLQNVFEKKNEH